jgi:hypothetical protein
LDHYPRRLRQLQLLQVAAQKQSGNLFLFTNFTFGKVLGTRDGSTSNGNGNGPVVNPFNLNSNYGALEYDHTKTFNVSFSYKLPKPIHNNFILGRGCQRLAALRVHHL